MALSKVTFTLDETTLAHLEETAERLSIPRSQVVREAIQELHAKLGRLSERERLNLLHAFDELVPRIPKRDARDVEREIAELRQARRRGGRGTGTGRRA